MIVIDDKKIKIYEEKHQSPKLFNVINDIVYLLFWKGNSIQPHNTQVSNNVYSEMIFM